MTESMRLQMLANDPRCQLAQALGWQPFPYLTLGDEPAIEWQQEWCPPGVHPHLMNARPLPSFEELLQRVQELALLQDPQPSPADCGHPATVVGSNGPEYTIHCRECGQELSRWEARAIREQRVAKLKQGANDGHSPGTGAEDRGAGAAAADREAQEPQLPGS